MEVPLLRTRRCFCYWRGERDATRDGSGGGVGGGGGDVSPPIRSGCVSLKGMLHHRCARMMQHARGPSKLEALSPQKN